MLCFVCSSSLLNDRNWLRNVSECVWVLAEAGALEKQDLHSHFTVAMKFQMSILCGLMEIMKFLSDRGFVPMLSTKQIFQVIG